MGSGGGAMSEVNLRGAVRRFGRTLPSLVLSFTLGFAALRDEWRDAATEISQKQRDGKTAGRDLAEAAKASKREGAGDAENKALLKAMGAEIKRLNDRVALAETAFLSMLNDLDELPQRAKAKAATTRRRRRLVGARTCPARGRRQSPPRPARPSQSRRTAAAAGSSRC